jgi:hypothetical protein
MAGCSQAIPSPLLGVIEDMYLNDTHNGRGCSRKPAKPRFNTGAI